MCYQRRCGRSSSSPNGARSKSTTSRRGSLESIAQSSLSNPSAVSTMTVLRRCGDLEVTGFPTEEGRRRALADPSPLPFEGWATRLRREAAPAVVRLFTEFSSLFFLSLFFFFFFACSKHFYGHVDPDRVSAGGICICFWVVVVGNVSNLVGCLRLAGSSFLIGVFF